MRFEIEKCLEYKIIVQIKVNLKYKISKEKHLKIILQIEKED